MWFIGADLNTLCCRTGPAPPAGHAKSNARELKQTKKDAGSLQDSEQYGTAQRIQGIESPRSSDFPSASALGPR